MDTSNDTPPPFEPTNIIELVSVEQSKITSVSLYSGRAEITRLYKFSVRTGQNQVNITGLPKVLDQESLRVEGRGAATIHDVTVSTSPVPPVASSSPALKDLLRKKERTQKALDRCQKSLASLETFLGTMNVDRIDVSQIGEVMQKYDTEGEKLDDKVLELQQQLGTLEEAINAERAKLAGPGINTALGLQAAIGVFAESGGEVEIALIYAVRSATWCAGYDIRVDMQTKEKPVKLIYKAAITQSTGEDWEDIPLTLETASPTFGLGVPHLNPWNLSIYKPVVYRSKSRSAGFKSVALLSSGGGSRSVSYDVAPQALYGFGSESAPMEHRGVDVSSKGNVSATFRVPGIISIPSDGQAHNVTIVQLQLDASMSWVSVPKEDQKTHLKASIKNASDFTLLHGNASVYVDGSFISRSNVPAVSPQESFDCPLGLDPSVRITYHPLSKKVSQSGFYQKTSNHIFSQRITIFNTKSTQIDGFKIVDQVPVSEDSQIVVKLISPALTIPSASGTVSKSSTEVSPITVSQGVIAQWDGADEPDHDVTALGRDGKFNWVCSVPAQGKINLLLQWEVTSPISATITGL